MTQSSINTGLQQHEPSGWARSSGIRAAMKRYPVEYVPVTQHQESLRQPSLRFLDFSLQDLWDQSAMWQEPLEQRCEGPLIPVTLSRVFQVRNLCGASAGFEASETGIFMAVFTGNSGAALTESLDSRWLRKSSVSSDASVEQISEKKLLGRRCKERGTGWTESSG